MAAPVFRARRSLDEPFTLDPIEQPREIVLRKKKRALELERPQASLARPFELEQDVIPSKRRQSRVLQGGLDAREREPLGFDEPRPGQHHRFGRSFRHARIASSREINATAFRLTAELELTMWMQLHLYGH